MTRKPLPRAITRPLGDLRHLADGTAPPAPPQQPRFDPAEPEPPSAAAAPPPAPQPRPAQPPAQAARPQTSQQPAGYTPAYPPSAAASPPARPAAAPPPPPVSVSAPADAAKPEIKAAPVPSAKPLTPKPLTPRPALPAAVPSSMAEQRREFARRVVARYTKFAAVGGLVPIPVASIAGVTAINVRMVQQLSGLYQVPFQHERTRSMIISLMGGTVPTGLGAAAASTLLFVPGGALVGLGVSAASAAAMTRGIGRVFVESFESAANRA